MYNAVTSRVENYTDSLSTTDNPIYTNTNSSVSLRTEIAQWVNLSSKDPQINRYQITSVVNDILHRPDYVSELVNFAVSTKKLCLRVYVFRHFVNPGSVEEYKD